ncbi:class D sortase [Metabacillus litoralis]|uniref:class D sortase n=1 Tax=Metabacillus litoralis TaxID=152268 RepID=UPI0020418EAC|nr:class D sortase [Metabacillus litoralis]MCM3654293.1 class D sortase [Metabacillus litoralis]
MRNRIGILLLVIGFSFFLWNTAMMNMQKQNVEHNPVKAEAIDHNWDDPIVEEPLKQDTDLINNEYSFHQGDEIGELTIPRIGNLFSIYYGTDKETLKKGVGLYESSHTALPTEYKHTALAGHRDTVFSELGNLEIGDRMYFVFDNIKYEYQIRDIWITDKEDRTVLVDKETPTLTLTTCYPFDFIGPAPQRYIIQSELVDKKVFHHLEDDAY